MLRVPHLYGIYRLQGRFWVAYSCCKTLWTEIIELLNWNLKINFQVKSLKKWFNPEVDSFFRKYWKYINVLLYLCTFTTAKYKKIKEGLLHSFDSKVYLQSCLRGRM